MADNKEQIDLIIDAQNLASDEFTQAAKDVRELGLEASKAEKKLDELAVDQANLQSFKEVGQELGKLKRILAESEVAYDKQAVAVKKNKEATDEERVALKLTADQLKKQRAEIRALETEQRKLAKQLKTSNVDTKNVIASQEKLNRTYSKVSERVEQLRENLTKQTDTLRKNVTLEKERRNELEKANSTTDKAVNAVKKYESELEKLNQELKQGKISKGDYIRSEEKLRQAHQLTEQQVKTSRRAIEADAKTKEKAGKSTDALTQVTRRLAQAYTVLLAAQKGTEAIRQSVTAYGDFEEALTKVEKTTGLAQSELVKIAETLTDQSQNVTPTATNELLRYAEVAGQMGVTATEDILRIASAADALQVSTDLAGDEAALLLTRILELGRNESVSNIDNLSSALVELGNNAKASESEIAFMTKELITGTQALDFSSAAALGLGTTLKELGRTGEASRSAFSRLSQVIKNAVNDGGDDLERLQKITGLTADQFKKDLGDTPEQVIIKFLQGLNRLDEGGQSVSRSLAAFGITSQDTAQVMEVLSKNTELLTKNTNLANKAYEDGNKHTEEAIKQYATQNSNLARLQNQFKGLATSIGEAYSDETNAAISTASDLITENREAVITLMEYLPQLGLALNEAFAPITAFTEGETLPLLSILAETVGKAFNGITVGLNSTLLAFNEASLAVGTFVGASEENLNKLIETSNRLRANIDQDLTDIENISKRAAGESSLAFEGLFEAVTKYGDGMKNLDRETQTQIQNIILSNEYNETLNGTYRKLTAQLVKASEEQRIKNELDTIAAEKKAKAIEQTQKQNEVVEKEIETITAATEVSKTYAEQIQELVDKYQSGAISAAEFEQEQRKLVDSQNALLISNAQTIDSFITVDQQLTAYRETFNGLNSALEAGLITQEQYKQSAVALNEAFELSINVTQAYRDNVNNITPAIASLNKEIADTEDAIKKLTDEQNNKLKSDRELKKINADLIKQQNTLAQLNKDKADLVRIENASYSQLVEMQRVYSQQLDVVEQQWRQGVITKAEYVEKTERIKAVLNELSAVLGENTEQLNKNTEAVIRNKNVTQGKVEQQEKLKSATNLAAGAYAHLNKEFNLSNKSTAELTARSKELVGHIRNNQKVTDQWWRSLARLSNQAFERERQIIKETLQLRKWQDQVESGTLSLEQLGRMALNVDRSFKYLSANQLEPLISAIDEARRKLRDFQEEVVSVTDEVQDRLDAALGKFDEIAKRRHERELAELQALLKQAELMGDSASVRKIRDAIEQLKKAQKLEYRQEFGEDKNDMDTFQGRYNRLYGDKNSSDNTQGVYKLSIDTSSGQSATLTGDKNDIETLLNSLTLAQGVNIRGEV